ncbi:MAG: hypothetical protein ABEJ98_03750 [Candidatus Nanohaloarchaea archaeon]
MKENYNSGYKKLIDQASSEEENSPGKVACISGSPRSHKTTQTMERVLKTNKENLQMVFVARTIDNVQSATKTYNSSHVSEKTLPYIIRVGGNLLCDNFPESDEYWLNRLKHREKCNRETDISKEFIQNKIFRNHQNLDVDTVNKLGEKHNLCGPHLVTETIRTSLHENKSFAIFTTYSSLPLMLDRTNFLDKAENAVFIFDEARYIPQLSRIDELELEPSNTRKSHLKIIFQWIEENLAEVELPQEMIERAESNLKGKLQPNLEKLINYIVEKAFKKKSKELKDGFKALEREEQIPVLKRIASSEVAAAIRDPDTGDVEKPKFKGAVTLKKELENYLAHTSNQEELKNLFTAISLLYELYEEDVGLDLDFINSIGDKNTVNLVLRKKTRRKESRQLFKEITVKSSETFLIDSTPPPLDDEIFTKWWWSLDPQEVDIDYTTHRPELDLIFEDARHSYQRFWQNKEDNLEKLEMLVNSVEGSVALFARSKEEASRLESEEFSNIYYARGTDSEGVEIDEDNIIALGLPLQNIHSEGYLRSDWENIIESDTARDKDKLMQSYRLTKAQQELLQISFRACKDSNRPTVIVLGTEQEQVESMKTKWKWLKDYNINYLEKNSTMEDKAFRVEALERTGRFPKIGLSQHRVRTDILGMLKISEEKLTKTELKSRLNSKLEKGYSDEKIRKQRNILEEKGIIEVEEVSRVPITYRLDIGCDLTGRENIFWE